MNADQIMYASGWVLWIVLVVALCGYVIFGNRKGFRVVATAMATILTVVMILIALDMGGVHLPEVKIAWTPQNTLNEILPQRATVTSTVTPIPTLTVAGTENHVPTGTSTVAPQEVLLEVTPTMTVSPTDTPKQTPIILDGNSVIMLNNDGTLVVHETETTKIAFIVTGDDPVLGSWFRTCTAHGTLYQADKILCTSGTETIIQLEPDVEYRFEGTQLTLNPLTG